MLTFICCPHAFNDLYGEIQTNSILSWKNLNIPKKIVVCCDEAGAKDFCIKHDLIHVPNVTVSKNGLPIISSIFHKGYKYADDGSPVCYINSDILLTSDFVETLKCSLETYPNLEKYLLCGKRRNWDKPLHINFEDGWEKSIKALNPPLIPETCAIDYFVHTKTTYNDIPNYAMGRFLWDNWLLGYCVKNNIFSIDVSNTVYVIHQMSSYSIKDKKASWNDLVNTEEGANNQKIGVPNAVVGNLDMVRMKSEFKNNKVVFLNKG